MIVVIDGQRVDPAAAHISIFDRGFLYGDGAFTVLRSRGARPIDLDRHLARLAGSGFPIRQSLAAIVHGALAGAAEDQRIRIIVTRGPGTLATPASECGPGRTIVVVEPLGRLPEAMTLAVVDLPIARSAGRAGKKLLAFAEHLEARELARAAGADEAVRLSPDGRVVEGSTCNLFAVVDGELVTPPLSSGALPGIVRGRIVELAGARERDVSLAELRGASEIFATSSLRGVVPVTRLDDRALAIHDRSATIARAYRDALDL